ncbi:Calx-beta domain-containing protein [Couchioplanes caeruleus]|uniref:Calx-beta domain-containing protein n=2 Tax=Couchioplanes caeruleus TaxID=56438 RepID=A0A1K0GH17_9ACTN|nr:Calx-beta domain-containing protein [Couchioplanes caeruleus]OJF10172.1 hypothetical protein BG844_33495 [Couchioplanes caeruleus subsp. caeruleus]ROP32893.1 Calx-beta domain-containing protein [Couchioplanes caeruleus]
MRYQPAHAAKSGSVPFMLRGPKSVRTALSAAVAAAIGFVPAVLITSPAEAAIVGYTITDTTVSATEGGNITIEITRAGGAAMLQETVTWAAAGGTATGLEDYDPASGSLVFPADATAPYDDQVKTITIATTDDAMDEVNETFTVTLTKAAETDTATATINDNDAPPGYTLNFDDASPSEADGSVNVTAELDVAAGQTVTIPISSADVTAKAGQDYTAIPDATVLTVLAGETTSDPVTITLTNDPLYEEAEQTLTVSGTADADVTGTDTATLTISDDEEQPSITIDPQTAAEGSPLAFDVHLSGPSEREVTAKWDTADGTGADLTADEADGHGTATAGADYTATAGGTVKFAAMTTNTPGVVTTAISVRTLSDSIDEASPEDMHVTLSSPTIAKLGADIEATGSITDDPADLPPVVTLLPSGNTVTEGSSGKKTQTYTVKLGKASGQEITVDYSTAAGTATDGQDFTAANGSLTFAPGETTKTFTVDIMGDTMYEGASETFDIDLASTEADVTAFPATITITEDDAQPTFTVGAVNMQEGDTGSVAVFPITLSNPADTNVEFDVAVVGGGSATDTGIAAGALDYITPQLLAVVPAGQTKGSLSVVVNGDDVYESNETVSFSLTPTSAVQNTLNLDPKNAVLSLLNDDDAPDLEIISTTAEEGDDVTVRGVVTGSAQDAVQLNVMFKGASVNGSTAASTSDFVDPGTVGVTIPGNTFSGATIAVPGTLDIVDDATAEGAETILVSGSGFGGGSVTDGVITIAASDGGTTPPPSTDKPTLTAAAAFRLGVGTLKLSGKAAAGSTVKLWGTPVGSDVNGTWEPLGTVTADASTGFYSFLPEFTTTGWWFRTTVGDTMSNTIKVNLKQSPDFFVRSSSRGTATLSVFGDPRVAGLSVRLLRAKTGGGWSTVASGTLDANGKFVKTLTGLRSGSSIYFKALVFGDSDVGLLTNYSNGARVTVR